MSEGKKVLSWDEAYAKANAFVEKLTLEEKMSFMYGINNMILFDAIYAGKIEPFKNSNGANFNGMILNDAPSGVRFAEGTSISWQAGINTAATFDKQLIYDIGHAQGKEFHDKGINVALGPCMNILRTPQSGRIFEAFGEDPTLSGIVAANFIKGMQDSGVIADAKHFICNETETYRRSSTSNVDERTLYEIYLEPFYRSVVDGEVGSIMCSYNAINGTYAFKNKKLLQEVLKDKIGFRGFVVSDWWAVYDDDPEGINGGLDMNMPGGAHEGAQYMGSKGSYWGKLPQYIKEGKVPVSRVTDAATRIIAAMYKMNQMENYPPLNMKLETKTEENKKLQRKAAAMSNVLLQNKEDILPIKNVKKIAVVGMDAFPRQSDGETDMNGVSKERKYYTGHVPIGYGSGTTTFGYLVTPLEGITERAKKDGIEVVSFGKLNDKGEEEIEGAVNVAKDADLVIICVQAISGEEYLSCEKTIGDRLDLDVLHNGNKLIEEVSKVNKNSIVVINAPAAVNVPWRDQVKAIIMGGYAGAESGNGLADVLFGDINPCGHLPYVWGKKEDYPVQINFLDNLSIVNDEEAKKFAPNDIKDADLEEFKRVYPGPEYMEKLKSLPNTPLNLGGPKTWLDIYRYQGGPNLEQYDYTEGIYVGQRWFDKKGIKPIYPFGFGLSYTTFELSNLQTKMCEKGLEAKLKIKNIGKVDGHATPLLFLRFPEEVKDYPIRVFKGFEKKFVKVGEEVECVINVDDHGLSYYSVELGKYVRPKKGEFTVYIGFSAGLEDIKLTCNVNACY